MRRALVKMLLTTTDFDKIESRALATLGDIAYLYMLRCAAASKDHATLSSRDRVNALDVFHGCREDLGLDWDGLWEWFKDKKSEVCIQVSRDISWDTPRANGISASTVPTNGLPLPPTEHSVAKTNGGAPLESPVRLANGFHENGAPEKAEASPYKSYRDWVQGILEESEDEMTRLAPLELEGALFLPPSHAQPAENGRGEGEVVVAAEEEGERRVTELDDDRPLQNAQAGDTEQEEARLSYTAMLPKDHPSFTDLSLRLFYQPTDAFEGTGIPIDDLPDQHQDLFMSLGEPAAATVTQSRKRSGTSEDVESTIAPSLLLDPITRDEQTWLLARKRQVDAIVERFAKFTIDHSSSSPALQNGAAGVANGSANPENKPRHRPWASTWMTEEMHEVMRTIKTEDIMPLDSLFLGVSSRRPRTLLQQLSGTLIEQGNKPLFDNKENISQPNPYAGGVAGDGVEQFARRLNDLEKAAKKDQSLALDMDYRRRLDIDRLKTLLHPT
ncbi:hypothetical protein EV182_002213 [Spiromyces aspiralis]|uniref:Uncharacterized protein n=1 Tax=Spiromyces aspiralis TaxID=68401 RepID=A0ACC1HW85_9FUNG|nr:hypothetical protein EV182_002213 [Spiromyces aspiralis]